MKSKGFINNNTKGITKRESRKQAYKSQILKIAQEEFLRKGFSSTYFDEIAELAGVTRRTLYRYYPSKLALYIGMFGEYLNKLGVEICKAITQPESSDKLLWNIFETLFKFTKNNEKFMRLYWMLDSDEFGGEIPEEIKRNVKEHTIDAFGSVINTIKKAQQDGYILNVKPLLLAHLMSAINKGIFIHTSKERRLDIADLGPDELFALVKTILNEGLFIKYSSKRKK